MKNSLRAVAAFVLVLAAAPVHAQGVFDLSAISSKLGMAPVAPPSTPGGPANANAGASVAPVVLTYKRSPELSAQNLQKFVAGIKQMYAEVGTQLEQGLASFDLFGAIDQGLAKYGTRADDMSDVMAIYYLSSWMAANGRDDDPTPAQVMGTKKLVQSTMSRVPEFSKLTDADKQATSEGILLQMFFNEMMVDGVKSDPAALAKVRAGIKEGAKINAGFEVDKFTLGANGLVAKK